MYTFETLKNIENRIPLIGRKAKSLINLICGGFNVPDGFVITPDETDFELAEYITENEKYAVRSSGLSEDMADASFAGMYDTFLNISGVDDIKNAVKKCVDGVNNQRVKAYLEKNNISAENCKMAVIVQKMVQAEKSGVAFSVDCVNGYDKQIIIESVSGLGEKLVSGQVTPDYYAYDWYDGKFVSYNGGILSETEVKSLSEIILNIQILYGFPVDVEWAIADGEIYILQARPITAVTYRAIQSEWTTADFRDGGVSASICKPLMASLYGLVFHPSFNGSLKAVKLMDNDNDIPLYDIFFSRPYWNLTQEKQCFSRLPGFVEKELDEDMGVSITYEGNGIVTKTTPKTLWTGIKVLSAVSQHLKNMRGKCEDTKRSLLSGLENIENSENADKMRGIWSKFVTENYYKSETTYFAYIFCNMILSSLFKDKVKKYLLHYEILNLMTGLEDISHMRPIYELWDMSRTEIDEKRFEEFIVKYKHHSRHELDISYPNWDEEQETVRDMIKVFASLGDEHNPKDLCALQKKKYENTLAKLPKKLHKDVERLRYFLWQREEFRDISTKHYYEVRKVSNALGELWVNSGVLNNTDDIYFLSVDDIVKGNTNEFNSIVKKNKAYYNSFRNYVSPNEIGSRFTTAKRNVSGEGILKGVVCGGVTITGTVRVIKDIHDVHRLQQGDILVTKCTDPAWTGVFSKISGVITETGGILSHAAVVSREYGISCILAVADATKTLKDGDRVTMDCETGQIYIYR